MDIGTRIGRHRQHRQWGGVRSTIEVPMLPMSAYVAAYVRFFVFLVACLCAYVLFGVFGLWAESWVSSQILGKLSCGCARECFLTAPQCCLGGLCFFFEKILPLRLRWRLRRCFSQGFGLRPRILPRGVNQKKAHRHIGTLHFW